MRCINCRQVFTPKRFLEKHCENCKEEEREWQSAKTTKTPTAKKPIKQISDKRKLEKIIYDSERIKFLTLPENKICPINGKEATTVHHKKGRTGSLYLDKRFWIALSMEGHKFVEEHPEWSKENGYSLNRL